jgi:uncharacterized membrane protein
MTQDNSTPDSAAEAAVTTAQPADVVVAGEVVTDGQALVATEVATDGTVVVAEQLATDGNVVLERGMATDGQTVVATARLSDDQGVLAQGAIAAQGDAALIVARFANPDVAQSIYGRLREAEAAGELDIDGVLVVKGGDDGKVHVQEMTEHSTRKGLKWGIVGGVVAGIFLPATIVAGAVALGVAGAAAGKARNLYHRIEVEKELAGVITPGTSGILCLVSATAADQVKGKMPEAEEVKEVPVNAETADAVKAAATAASGEAAPSGEAKPAQA